tara:strand:- start:519 stop:908 length:390 start_codon:yes stop_codon:yes gene_type:complete
MSQASITECNTANDAANALLNGGTIEIKSGAEPDIDGAISGTILETFVIPATAFGASSNRIATMNAVTAIVAVSVGSGTPYHYVAKDSGGNIRRSGTAGTSGTDMILSAATWGIGDDLTITAWTTQQPK